MNNHDWINDLNWQDLSAAPEHIEGDEIYTLQSRDFLHMPVINFLELAAVDPDVRALMN